MWRYLAPKWFRISYRSAYLLPLAPKSLDISVRSVLINRMLGNQRRLHNCIWSIIIMTPSWPYRTVSAGIWELSWLSRLEYFPRHSSPPISGPHSLSRDVNNPLTDSCRVATRVAQTLAWLPLESHGPRQTGIVRGIMGYRYCEWDHGISIHLSPAQVAGAQIAYFGSLGVFGCESASLIKIWNYLWNHERR